MRLRRLSPPLATLITYDDWLALTYTRTKTGGQKMPDIWRVFTPKSRPAIFAESRPKRQRALVARSPGWRAPKGAWGRRPYEITRNLDEEARLRSKGREGVSQGLRRSAKGSAQGSMAGAGSMAGVCSIGATHLTSFPPPMPLSFGWGSIACREQPP